MKTIAKNIYPLLCGFILFILVVVGTSSMHRSPLSFLKQTGGVNAAGNKLIKDSKTSVNSTARDINSAGDSVYFLIEAIAEDLFPVLKSLN